MEKIYEHGITVDEKATSYEKVEESTGSIICAIGTAPINLVENPEAAVNQCMLIKKIEDLNRAMGYSLDMNYTLNQVAYSALELKKISPVVFINVLDPKKHKKTNTKEKVTVVNGQAVLKTNGVLLDTVSITDNGTALTQNTDFLLSFDSDGHVIITFTKEVSANVEVSSESIDPSLVTAQDIIGGYDVATGKKSGIELVDNVFLDYGIYPGIVIIAPKYSSNTNVAAVLTTKAELLAEEFGATSILDLKPSAKNYEECEAAKKEMGVLSPKAILAYPMLKKNGMKLYYSAVLAAVICRLDKENDDVPCVSYSNQNLDIDAILLEDGLELMLSKNEANALNSLGIVTMRKMGSFQTWGNNTSCFPDNQDVKDRWIGVSRFFTWQANRFIQDYFEKVDAPMNVKQIEALVDSENMYCNSLVSTGKCAGARLEYLSEENTTESILEGKARFHQYLAPFLPMEVIHNTTEFSIEMLENALSTKSTNGGEQ